MTPFYKGEIILAEQENNFITFIDEGGKENRFNILVIVKLENFECAVMVNLKTLYSVFIYIVL